MYSQEIASHINVLVAILHALKDILKRQTICKSTSDFFVPNSAKPLYLIDYSVFSFIRHDNFYLNLLVNLLLH